MMIGMDIDEARALLRTQHNAVLATRKRDGSPAMTPVTVGLGDDGRAVISSRQSAYKVKNLRRDPRAWLCVLPDGFYGKWISIAGAAEVVDLPDAMDGLIDYYRRISGEHPDWDDYRAAMIRDRRVLIRIRIETAGPDVSG
jgi:PPOX class probable F420-dependent enzyme